MEDIINDYLNDVPVKYICLKYKIGKKKLHKLLTSHEITLRKRNKHSKQFPFKKGEIIDGVTILDDDYFFDGERWTIRFQCRCGKIDNKRSYFIGRKNIFTACKYCAKESVYEDQRHMKTSMFNKNGINKVWLSDIKNNLQRGLDRTIECDISDEDLYEKLKSQDSKCALTGETLEVLWRFKFESDASVDRIDSSKGYHKDNIQWLLKSVNKMKMDCKQDIFIDLCKKISEHFK